VHRGASANAGALLQRRSDALPRTTTRVHRFHASKSPAEHTGPWPRPASASAPAGADTLADRVVLSGQTGRNRW
jgi:hypothetical protein